MVSTSRGSTEQILSVFSPADIIITEYAHIINISYKSVDIFDMKSAIGTKVPIFSIDGLKSYCQILTLFSRKVSHLESNSFIKISSLVLDLFYYDSVN